MAQSPMLARLVNKIVPIGKSLVLDFFNPNGVIVRWLL